MISDQRNISWVFCHSLSDVFSLTSNFLFKSLVCLSKKVISSRCVEKFKGTLNFSAIIKENQPPKNEVNSIIPKFTFIHFILTHKTLPRLGHPTKSEIHRNYRHTLLSEKERNKLCTRSPPAWPAWRCPVWRGYPTSCRQDLRQDQWQDWGVVPPPPTPTGPRTGSDQTVLDRTRGYPPGKEQKPDTKGYPLFLEGTRYPRPGGTSSLPVNIHLWKHNLPSNVHGQQKGSLRFQHFSKMANQTFWYYFLFTDFYWCENQLLGKSNVTHHISSGTWTL